ncbi:sugar transferase [Methylobacterium nigriterrae]|uniref:sugar transferase n=1 Tax=Methylobacterium nigriterrae TaxID=3127512 RepID=UPI003013F800
MTSRQRLAIDAWTTVDPEREAHGIRSRQMRAGPRLGKRAVDLALACPILALSSPLMLMAYILIRLTSRGPALIRQTRIGQHERPFAMFKFRTMRLDADDTALRRMNILELAGNTDPGTSDGAFKPDADPRVTKVGRLLRRFSVDELPQLFNVLSGEMSLVGPRPSLPWEVKLYTPAQRMRHACLPGMTGLWQVSGRNRLPMPQMLRLDLVYARSWSLSLDLWILCRTPGAVLFDRTVR